MGARSMTAGRYEEIRRRLTEGRGVREIACALNRSRDTVRELRDGERQPSDSPRHLQTHCECCSWIGLPSFTNWVWGIQ